MPKEPRKLKKKQGKMKGILITAIMIGGIGLIVYLNRGTIGKLVADVPGLNKVFKVQNEEPADNRSRDQLMKDNKVLEASIVQLKEQLLEKEQSEALLKQKIETLKQYEAQYNDFIAQKEAWNTEIANANPALFLEQYEKINPELAKNLYKDLMVQENMTKEQKKYANVIAEMDADQAAKALEKLVGTDPELIKSIFKAMDAERQAAILSAMESQYAAQVIKLISP